MPALFPAIQHTLGLSLQPAECVCKTQPGPATPSRPWITHWFALPVLWFDFIQHCV